MLESDACKILQKHGGHCSQFQHSFGVLLEGFLRCFYVSFSVGFFLGRIVFQCNTACETLIFQGPGLAGLFAILGYSGKASGKFF